MLNLLRARGLKLFCVGATVMMLAWVIALIASIGCPKAMANPQVPLASGLLVAETIFSLVKKP